MDAAGITSIRGENPATFGESIRRLVDELKGDMAHTTYIYQELNGKESSEPDAVLKIMDTWRKLPYKNHIII